jgi:glycosyltransferase involved in cell wall biosynthesis
MRILLSAYACEPGRGSEPGVGWNVAYEVAKHHLVWVLTSNTHRPQIEVELAARPVPNLQIVYLDPFGWVYDWSQEGKRASWDVHLHYYLWQILAYFTARRLHQDIEFDVVHHVTYVQYARPSFMGLLPIPFVWGPVGGGESAPFSFWQDFNLRGRVYETVRMLSHLFSTIDPFIRLTALRSTIARATTLETADRLAALGAKQIGVVSQLGLSQPEIQTLAQLPLPGGATIRFVSIGRLLHWKGFHLGLQAFASAAIPGAEYWIIGVGPEHDRLKKEVERLGICSSVNFLGNLPRLDTLAKLGECHVLVHPSLHDSGALVCLEAMAAGRPVLCLNLGGPAANVTPEVGFKIEAEHPQQVVQDLATAMVRLANDAELRSQMGKAGQQLVREQYSWDAKGLQLSQLYAQIESATQHREENRFSSAK